MKLTLNGRFLNRPVTGVERLAIELNRSLRHVLAAMGERDVDVVVPVGTPVEARSRDLGEPTPSISIVGKRTGHIWEQLDLVRAVPDSWLLGLCNTGPVARRRQALVICDAQIVLHPESYSLLFRSWYRVMMTLAARRAKAVFTISEFSKTQLEKFGFVPPGKAHVLRLGVDHLQGIVPDASIIASHDLDARPYILAIGSLARHKNLAMLLDAFVEADLPGIDMVVAGGGNNRVFQDAGLPKASNIRYLGRVSDGELKALYGRAYAFACPSLSEGFGFTPLEAMTMGCPVVATTGGAVPEVCGDAALYADPYDRHAWRTALRRIVDDRDLRAELGRRAKERASLFVWRETARQMLTILAAKDKDEIMQAKLEGLAI